MKKYLPELMEHVTGIDSSFFCGSNPWPGVKLSHDSSGAPVEWDLTTENVEIYTTNNILPIVMLSF